jgi:type 1 glutamine amidotransferase
MARLRSRSLLVLLLAAGLASCEASTSPSALPRLLVFSKTTGFRHASIPAAIAAVQQIGAAVGFAVEATEDAAIFNAVSLERFDAVMFLSTTGDVLDSAQQVAFEGFVQNGGGFVGVHSATDTEYAWPWYGGLVGAYFKSHPAIQQATITVVASAHPATESLPLTAARTDEWYDFLAQPLGVTVLVTVDETTYTGGTMGTPHPVSWCHAYDGGRAFYTAMGHTEESYADALFLAHLAGGIRWAMQLD